MKLTTNIRSLLALSYILVTFHMAFAQCTPSRENRISETSTVVRMDCAARGYACNIADLRSDGTLLGSAKTTTLSAQGCSIIVDPGRNGGQSQCRMLVNGDVSFSAGISVSGTGPSVTGSVSAGTDRTLIYRNNCSAW